MYVDWFFNMRLSPDRSLHIFFSITKLPLELFSRFALNESCLFRCIWQLQKVFLIFYFKKILFYVIYIYIFFLLKHSLFLHKQYFQAANKYIWMFLLQLKSFDRYKWRKVYLFVSVRLSTFKCFSCIKWVKKVIFCFSFKTKSGDAFKKIIKTHIPKISK